jgi:hypothetical protein
MFFNNFLLLQRGCACRDFGEETRGKKTTLKNLGVDGRIILKRMCKTG